MAIFTITNERIRFTNNDGQGQQRTPAVGRQLKFALSASLSAGSVTFNKQVLTLNDAGLFVVSGCPMAADPLTIGLRVDGTETDKRFSESGNGETQVVLTGTSSQHVVVDVPIKEVRSATDSETAANGKPRKKPQKTTFHLGFVFEVKASDTQYDRQQRAQKFVPDLNKALDAVLPVANAGCAINRDDVFDLLMNTANHESDFFRAVSQYYNGKGRGLVQMEEKTYNSLWVNFLSQPGKAELAQSLRQLAGSGAARPKVSSLKSNTVFAAAMAFTRYLEHADGKDIPSKGDRAAQAEYWLDHYRMRRADETPEKWEDLKKKFRDDCEATFGKPAAGAAAPPPAELPKKKVLDQSLGL